MLKLAKEDESVWVYGKSVERLFSWAIAMPDAPF
jgi:hypothetical protein